MSAAENSPLVETDAGETVMTYDEGSRVPGYVILVWTAAAVGLGTYGVLFYLRELAAWGSP